MANQYKNKVVYNGTTLIDLSDTTAVQSDVASGKYFYTASGQRVQGTGQGGSSGYTRTVIIPEQTVTPTHISNDNINGYMVDLSNVITEPLEQWTEYIVTFNGTEYYTTAILMWGTNILLGEQAYYWSGTGYPYPFGMLYADNTCSLAVGSADAVTIKVEKIEFNGSGGSTDSGTIRENIVPEQTVTGTTQWALIPNSGTLIEGEYYAVTVNGEEKISTGTVNDGIIYISFIDWDWDKGGYAFGSNVGANGVYFRADESSSYTIKVDKLTISNDIELITKTITANGTYTALNDSVDGYSEVVVNVSSGSSEPIYETVFDDSINVANYISIESLSGLHFAEGETWRVTWDGVEYICQTAIYDGWLWTVGNQSLSSVDDGENEPFLLYNYTGDAMNGNARTGGTHTLKLEKQISSGDGSTSPLSGKILAITGDSIAAGAGYTGGYAGIIGSEQGMIVQNIAVGGGTIVNTGSTFCISESISNLRSDADFVLLEGGGNDSDANITLGTLTSGYTDTLDTTTFAGAFEQMLKSAIARFPNKKIGYILIHKCAYQFDSRVPNSYYDMVINACKKWGIPYLDLNTQVPPLNYLADLRTTYTANADGYHPNELGYRTFYVPKITAFLNTMLTDNSLINKIVTTNGTYLASDDSADGYSSVTVSVTPNLQSKSATPTTSSQTISPDNGYDGLSSVTVGAIPSQYIVPTGNKAITENGTGIDVTQYATVSVSVSGSSMNVQTSQSTSRRNNTALGSVASLTCSTAGTYDVYWSCARSSTSGTWGSQLYINGTAYGTENTTFSNHVQNNHLTGVTIPANATVAVYGRSRSGYYIYVPQLTIKQTA